MKANVELTSAVNQAKMKQAEEDAKLAFYKVAHGASETFNAQAIGLTSALKSQGKSQEEIVTALRLLGANMEQ
jgi:hypothetical protein